MEKVVESDWNILCGVISSYPVSYQMLSNY